MAQLSCPVQVSASYDSDGNVNGTVVLSGNCSNTRNSEFVLHDDAGNGVNIVCPNAGPCTKTFSYPAQCVSTGTHPITVVGFCGMIDAGGGCSFPSGNATGSYTVAGNPTVSITHSPAAGAGHEHFDVSFNFPHTTVGAQRDLRVYRTSPSGVRVKVYDAQYTIPRSGTVGFDDVVECLADGTYIYEAVAISCNGDTATGQTTVDLNMQPSVSISASLHSNSNVIYDVTITYSFPRTEAQQDRTVDLYAINPSGNRSRVFTANPSTMSGTLQTTVNTDCWPDGTNTLEAVATACTVGDTARDSTTIQIDHTPQLSLTVVKNADGTSTAQGSYFFPQTENGVERQLRVELLPTLTQGGQILLNRGGGLDPLPQDGTFSVNLSSSTFGMLRATAVGCSTPTVREAAVIPTVPNSCATTAGGGPGSAGDPVRFWDGAMFYLEQDPLPNDDFPLFRRQYSSANTVNGRFGLGWTSLFDAGIVVANNPWIQSVVVFPDPGEVVAFRLLNGVWTQSWPQGRLSGTLTGSESAGYSYRAAGSTLVRVFGSNHKLIELKDLQTGRRVLFTYDGSGMPTGLADDSGRWGCTITTANGHVTQVAVDGRSDLQWNYTYSGTLLQSVALGGGTPWRTYEYAGNRLSAIRDSLSHTIEQHSYDSLGRATNSLGPSGDITLIEYLAGSSPGESVTRFTRADGSQTTYLQSFGGGRDLTTRVIGGCQSCGMSDATYAYDSVGRATRVQNGRGYVTQFSYLGTGSNVASVWSALLPEGCNPETDPAHCQLTSAALATATLLPTSSSSTVSYTYDDPAWPERPTSVTQPSVANPGQVTIHTFTFDATTGAALTDTSQGYVGTVPEQHTTTSTLYDGSGGAAFVPGGAFDSSWLTLPQPRLRKSVDGPRTDVPDISQWVYYPVNDAVPAWWRGRLAATRNAAGLITRFENYNVFGLAGRIIDPNGVATESSYDPLGRLSASTNKAVAGCDTVADPLCATDLTSSRTYSAIVGPLASETRPNGATSTYEYDGRGRLAAIVRPVSTSSWDRMECDYDPSTGKKSAERYLSGQPGAWTLARSEAYRYDTRGRLSAVDHPDGKSVLYTYDLANNLATLQDENHTAPNTSYTYDPLNRLLRVTQTLATASSGSINTQYAYDLQGNLISVTDPNGNVTTYTFDDFRQMRTQVSPVTGTTTYAYDLGGNLTSTTDANAASTTRSYDSLSRVITSSSSAGSVAETVSWAYDDATAGRFAIGRLASMTDPTGSSTYSYQRLGLLRAETKTIAGAPYTTGYAYDADGNRSSITYPSGRVVTYGFDKSDRPVSAQSGSTVYVASAGYLPFGPMTQLVYGNGTTKTMQYDARYRPLENKLTGPAGVIADYNYAEDGAGNITQIHDGVDPTYNRDFGYDDLNRLTTANSGASLWGAGSYTYDAMGNMVSSALGSRTAAFSYSGTTSKLSSVVENGAARSVSYDPAGNESVVGGAPYAYTPRNSLQSAGGIAYSYDGRGVRTVTSYPAYYISALSLSASTLYTNQSGTGTVTLGGAAPAGGAVVQLSSSSASVLVPGSVTVPEGGTSAVFGITQAPGAAPGVLTITAIYGYTRTASLTLAAGPAVASVAFSPSSVVGGTASTGTVTLAAAAPAGGAPVSLSSDDAAAVVPSSVTVAPGSTTASFSVTTSPVTTAVSAVIHAAYGNSVSNTLDVQPPSLASLTLQPASVMGGHPVTGTVSLNGPAPAGGLGLSLSSANASLVGVPATVTIPAGAVSQDFAVTTTITSTDTTVVITGTLAGQSRTATLAVTHCIPAAAAAPTIPAGDVVWLEDGVPSGATMSGTGMPLQWSTAQAASGTSSLMSAWNGLGIYGSKISNLSVRSEIGEVAVLYVWLSECNPPREIQVRWGEAFAGEVIAQWGADALPAHGINMGPLPAPGQWARLEVPFSLLRFEQRNIASIRLDMLDGQVAWDHIGKAGTACIAAHASAPSIPSGDTVWIEDGVPSGATLTNTGAVPMQWSTSQAASGTSSLLSPWGGSGVYGSKFTNLNLRAEIGESGVVYVWMNECMPPREIQVRWGANGTEVIAQWGADVMGAHGTNMGPLPAAGQWARLEVPFSQLRYEQKPVTSIRIDAADGQFAVDHVGKSGTACIPAVAPQPSMPSGDTVWIDDALPAGASLGGVLAWDTSQSASGTRSIAPGYGGPANYEGSITGLSQPLNTGESAVFYVRPDECAPPTEILVRWSTTPYNYHVAYWGPTGLGGEGGGLNMGAVPPAGIWTRIQIPLSQLQLENYTLIKIDISYRNGHAWFDHIGKSGPPPAVLTSFTASPQSPQPAGTAITFTASATAYVSPAQYRFERQDNGTWTTVQAYGSASSYSWTPASGDAGDHAIRVSVRNAGSLVDFEDTQTLSYTVSGGSGLMTNPAGRMLLALRRLMHRSVPPLSLAAGAQMAIHPTSSSTANRYSFYTPELNLMAETETTAAASPAIANEYIWFAGQPVAQVSGSTTRWTFDDHLGTPVIQTDSTGAVVWRTESDPYGTTFATRAGVSLYQPLRLPGQEDDALAPGRDYNIFRWYRGGWARYTQADPLELSGGINLYRYSIDNPVNFFDSTGLVSVARHVTKTPVYTLQDLDSRCRMTNGGVSGGGCTPTAYAIGHCTCRCFGANDYRPDTQIDITAAQFAFNGPWALLRRSRTPHPSVHDYASALAHEDNYHLDPATAKLLAEVAQRERTSYADQATCDTQGCTPLAAFVNREFTRLLHESQRIEEAGGDPRQGLQ